MCGRVTGKQRRHGECKRLNGPKDILRSSHRLVGARSNRRNWNRDGADTLTIDGLLFRCLHPRCSTEIGRMVSYQAVRAAASSIFRALFCAARWIDAGWGNLATLQAPHGPALYTLYSASGRNLRALVAAVFRLTWKRRRRQRRRQMHQDAVRSFCFLECTLCLSWHRLYDLYERRSAPVDTDAGGLCLASAPGGVSMLVFRQVL